MLTLSQLMTEHTMVLILCYSFQYSCQQRVNSCVFPSTTVLLNTLKSSDKMTSRNANITPSRGETGTHTHYH